MSTFTPLTTFLFEAAIAAVNKKLRDSPVDGGVYVDDGLLVLMVRDYAEALLVTNMILKELLEMGAILSLAKIQLGTTVVALGMTVDLQNLTLSIPAKRSKQVLDLLGQVLDVPGGASSPDPSPRGSQLTDLKDMSGAASHEPVAARVLARLYGKEVQALALAAPALLPLTRPLAVEAVTKAIELGEWFKTFVLSGEARRILALVRTWLQEGFPPHSFVGPSVLGVDWELQTDACETGLGGLLLKRRGQSWERNSFWACGLPWCLPGWHSTWLELLGCVRGLLQAMAHVPAGAVIRLRTDCVAAHGALTKGAAEGGVRGMLVELFWAIVRLWVEGVLFAHCWLVECGCGLPFQDL